MSMTLLVVLTVLLLMLSATIWGLFTKKRSIIVALVALALGSMMAFVGLYAWFESHSLAWAIAYGIVAMIAFSTTLRQFFFVSSSE